MMAKCRGRWFGVWVFGLVLVACGSGSNAEDERRLAIVVVDPLLDVRPSDAQIDPVAGSGSVLAESDNPLSSGCCQNAAVVVLETPDDQAVVLDLYLGALAAGGWSDISARCSVRTGLIILNAARQEDGFTVRTSIDLSPSDDGTWVQLVIRAPFHTSNGQEVVGAEPSLDCIDKPEPTP